jgi:hypothetical protein
MSGHLYLHKFLVFLENEKSFFRESTSIAKIVWEPHVRKIGISLFSDRVRVKMTHFPSKETISVKKGY